MNSLLKFAAFILIAGTLVHLSCQKELSCENCSGKNKLPIANAGADQAILLPTDSVSLDGSASYDPDGTIISYKWIKISGPGSSNIIKTDSSKTQVKNLLMGVYTFQLLLKDNGGLSAKDTIMVVVNDPAINQAPVACAGADPTITLPSNTVNLDGSGSTDPDNNITSYAWTKISGPSSFNIVNANVVQTQVTNIVEGVYQFELKVTDAGALFSRDTMQVTVVAQPPPSCDNSNRPLVNAQLIPFGTLSKPRMQIAVASAGTKIVFAGGRWTPDCPDCWGSSRVDIYDTVTHQWSTTELSQGRWGIGTVTVGNKIFFAGGERGDGAFNSIYSTVDIYDAAANTWSVASLSEPRSYIAAATVGNKVFFAGGWQEDTQFVPPTSKVDIYDLSSNTWSTASLSEPRGGISAVTVSQKIYFAGGLKIGSNPSNKIDIYDNVSQSWTTSTLLSPKAGHSGIASADKIYWAADCNVEIKNVNTGNSTNVNLFGPGWWLIDDGQNAVIKNNKIIFYRPYAPTDRFDIYDIATNSWSIGVLPQNNIEYSSIIAINNTIYIAGGWNNNQVWKLEF